MLQLLLQHGPQQKPFMLQFLLQHAVQHPERRPGKVAPGFPWAARPSKNLCCSFRLQHRTQQFEKYRR
jgi:hypothetical protein